jgi:hypothetical protein
MPIKSAAGMLFPDTSATIRPSLPGDKIGKIIIVAARGLAEPGVIQSCHDGPMLRKQPLLNSRSDAQLLLQVRA